MHAGEALFQRLQRLQDPNFRRHANETLLQESFLVLTEFSLFGVYCIGDHGGTEFSYVD